MNMGKNKQVCYQSFLFKCLAFPKVKLQQKSEGKTEDIGKYFIIASSYTFEVLP